MTTAKETVDPKRSLVQHQEILNDHTEKKMYIVFINYYIIIFIGT